MGVIAWTVLGLIAGYISDKLVGGKHGPIVTTLVGVAGALLGGWIASQAFHAANPHEFFNVSTWITAIAGSVVLLIAYHLATTRRAVQQAGPRR